VNKAFDYVLIVLLLALVIVVLTRLAAQDLVRIPP